MSTRRVWDVEPRKSGSKPWAVQREGTERADSLHDRKSDAIERARELAREAGPRGQMRVKNRDGQIQYEHTYGNDPERSPG